MTRTLPRFLFVLLLLSLIAPVAGAAPDASFYHGFQNVDPYAAGWIDISTTAGTWSVAPDPAGLHGTVLSGVGFSTSAHGILAHPLGFSVNLADPGLVSWGCAFYVPSTTDYSLALFLGNPPAEDVIAFYVLNKSTDRLLFIAENEADPANDLEVQFPWPGLATDHWYHLKLEQADTGPVEIRITDMETWTNVFYTTVAVDPVLYSGMSYIGAGIETGSTHYFDEFFCEFFLHPVATERASWGRIKALY